MHLRAPSAISAVLFISCLALVSGAHAAEPGPWPRLYLGAAGGANLVLGDWDISELDDDGRPAGAESSAVVRLRVGVDLADWLALELEGGIIPTSAGGESALVGNVGGHVRIPFSRGTVEPFGLVGAGVMINGGGDRGGDEDPEGHYGLGVAFALGDAVDLRVEARHVMSDGLTATLSHSLELLASLDVTVFRAGDDEPPPPDRDGDGVPDDRDDCPEEAGERARRGCPAPPPPSDTDGDGIADDADRCPNERGVASHGGCPAPPTPIVPPDADGDGVPDADDRCPNQSGPSDRGGCPKPANPLEGLDAPVPFGTNSSQLSPEAEAALDRIAAVMKAEPDLRLRIDGHADARGTDEHNIALSIRRAERVRNLLVSRGVERSRMDIRGLGEEQPAADNDGPDGWAKNRRVEIYVISR